MIFTRLADFGYLDTTYTVNIPIGISVSGTVLSLVGGTTATFSLSSAQLGLYYNSGFVDSRTYGGATLSMTVDLGGSVVGSSFAVQNQYVGNLTFGGWRIYSAPSYVYQWYALVHLSYTGTASIGGVSLNTVVSIAPSVQATTSGSVVVRSSTTGINGGTTIVTL
jgi:hypothetical protein